MTGKFISYGREYSKDYEGTEQFVSFTKNDDGYGLYVHDAEGSVSSIVPLNKELKDCSYIIQVVAFEKGVTKSELNVWKQTPVDFVNTLNYSRTLVNMILSDSSEVITYVPSFCIKDLSLIVAKNKGDDLSGIGVDSGDVIG